MNNTERIRKMTGMAILLALTVVLTAISNQIQIAGVAINLSLIPIAIAAVVYGPWAGLLMGLANGGMVMLSAAAFFAINPWATPIVCLVKTGAAGLIAGFVFKAFKNHRRIGYVVSAFVVPFINTGLFIVGAVLWFGSGFGELISLFIGVNFLVELGVTAILSPAIIIIEEFATGRYQKKKAELNQPAEEQK